MIDAVATLVGLVTMLGGFVALVWLVSRQPPSKPRLSPAREAHVAALLRKKNIDADVNLNAVATSIRLHGATGHHEHTLAPLRDEPAVADALGRLARHGPMYVDDDDLVLPIDRETAIRWTEREIARFVDDVVAIARAFARLPRPLAPAHAAALEAESAPSGAPFAVPIERSGRR